jgi:SAM-dependent methyltransferase
LRYRNNGSWDALTYDQVSRLVQYRWGQQVIKWRKWHGDEIVMDASCGSGLLTKQLAKQVPRGKVYAVDIDYNMIKQAKNNLPILIGWAWRPSDIDIKAYQSIKDINVRRDLIKSIKNKCDEKGLSISLNPDEENLLEVRVSKILPLESLVKSEFLETVSKLVSMWAFFNLEFRFHTISRADFDPSQQV